MEELVTWVTILWRGTGGRVKLTQVDLYIAISKRYDAPLNTVVNFERCRKPFSLNAIVHVWRRRRHEVSWVR